MLLFLLKRLGVMLLTALCLTAIVFSLVNLKPNLVKLAKEQGSSQDVRRAGRGLARPERPQAAMG
jgi:ABC-type dipeptide/oligopeptide/nickel transport system permease component